MGVQHIILASQMINLGFLVGLFTYNARLAKSHVVMSCKLFCHWLVWILTYKFVIPFNNFSKWFVYTHTAHGGQTTLKLSNVSLQTWSPLMLWAPPMEKPTVSEFLCKSTQQAVARQLSGCPASVYGPESPSSSIWHIFQCATYCQWLWKFTLQAVTRQFICTV